jgi:hypothetical protein
MSASRWQERITMTKINIVEATRDAVLAEGASFTFAENDNGIHYIVVDATVEGQRFVLSQRTGMIAMLTRTGRAPRYGGRRAGMVRVRFDYATDAGREDSTCAFGIGEHIGGWAPAYVFPEFA